MLDLTGSDLSKGNKVIKSNTGGGVELRIPWFETKCPTFVLLSIKGKAGNEPSLSSTDSPSGPVFSRNRTYPLYKLKLTVMRNEKNI